MKNVHIKNILSAMYAVLVLIIVTGIAFILGYIIYESHRDPVNYISLNINQPEITTSTLFTYDAESCRNAGPEVTGSVTRSFVKVEQKDGKWVDAPDIAPIQLFESIYVSNDKGCRTVHVTALVPIMPEGYYKLRIIGVYNVLSFLSPSVDKIDSNIVHVKLSSDDTQALILMRTMGTSSSTSTNDQSPYFSSVENRQSPVQIITPTETPVKTSTPSKPSPTTTTVVPTPIQVNNPLTPILNQPILAPVTGPLGL